MISLCEFLNTVNKDKFISLLQKEFKDYVLAVTSNEDDMYYGWGHDIIACEVGDEKLVTDKNKIKEFVSFCRKYNYVASMLIYDVIFIEPIKSQKKISGRVVYHITDKDLYYERIIKKGLKCRGNTYKKWNDADLSLMNNPAVVHFGNEKHFSNSNSYRTITPRIYVIATDDEDKIKKIADQIGKLGIFGNGIVLKIDLENHPNIDLYQDNANLDDSEAYYTLEDIPADIISVDDELTEFISHR